MSHSKVKDCDELNLFCIEFDLKEYHVKEDLIKGKKQKVAILITYSGQNYYGLQHNPGDAEHVTIELKIFEV